MDKLNDQVQAFVDDGTEPSEIDWEVYAQRSDDAHGTIQGA